MGGILGYARVSTGDKDVADQTMRLPEARPRASEICIKKASRSLHSAS